MLRVHYCRPVVKELASGVDALYLSGRTQLDADLVQRLTEAKSAAQDTGQPVPFEFGGYQWEAKPFGLTRNYGLRIDHPLAAVGFSTAEKIPSVRVQARAEALHSPLGPDGIVRWITTVMRNEGLPISWTVSRLDLHADVQGWVLSGNDRHRLVSRAKARATYEEDGTLSGFTIGKRKTKTINGRIYDKTLEIAGNGHDWWFDIWGDKFDCEHPVWRIEFELHRAVLKEMQLNEPADVLAATDRIWAYASRDWLTYRRPTGHDRPARWPLSPEWEKIQRVTLAGTALPIERIRAGRAVGGLRTTMPGLNGYATTFGAWTGHDDIDSMCAALPEYLRAYETTSGRTFADRVAEKRRKHQ